MAHEYVVTGDVELFPQEGGWYYLAVPTAISEELADFADRGLVAIRATIGETSWDTSLLPKGDGTQFIALKASVRQAARVDVGDRVTVRFQLRSRN